MTDLTVVLTPRDALVADISTPPGEQHFDVEPDIEVCNVELRFGRSPLVRDLSEQSKLTGQALGPELKYLQTRFRVVLLTTSLSVLKLPGICRISSLKYVLDFDQNTEVAIVDMLPKAEVLDKVQVSLGTNSSLRATVNAKGQFDLQVPIAGVGAGAGVNVATDNKAGILADFGYTFHSIRTQAIGLYSKTGIWNLVSDTKPLVGDLIFATTFLIDELLDAIKFRVQASVAVSRVGLFPETRESAWIPYGVKIPAGPMTR